MRRSRRLLSYALLASAFVGSAGCLQGLPRLPPPEQAEPCRAVPELARKHIYIFLLDGFDPIGCGELAEVRTYLNQLGFTKTYNGQAYHAWHFAREMRRIHKEDPDALFVLIGTIWGRTDTLEVAHMAHSDGLPVRLIVRYHCDGATTPCRGQVGGKETQVWCLPSGPNPESMHKLAWELAVIAGTVPIPLPPLPKLPGAASPQTPIPPDVEIAPPPRPLPVMPPASASEGWDVLTPTYQLKSPPSYTLTASPRGKKDSTNTGPKEPPK